MESLFVLHDGVLPNANLLEAHALLDASIGLLLCYLGGISVVAEGKFHRLCVAVWADARFENMIGGLDNHSNKIGGNENIVSSDHCGFTRICEKSFVFTSCQLRQRAAG